MQEKEEKNVTAYYEYGPLLCGLNLFLDHFMLRFNFKKEQMPWIINIDLGFLSKNGLIYRVPDLIGSTDEVYLVISYQQFFLECPPMSSDQEYPRQGG